MLYIELIIFALLGLGAGILSGLLGLGGGLIIVPGLLFIFKLAGFKSQLLMHMAAGTSLACMLPTATMAVYSFHQRKLIDWTKVTALLPGMMTGILSGSFFAASLHSELLEMALGILFIIVSIQFIFNNNEHKTSQKTFPHPLITFIFGSFFGFMSGLLGVGGGMFLIPFLVYFSTPMQKASGTASACLLLPVLVGVISFIFLGQHQHDRMFYTTGFIYWPAVFIIALFSTPSVQLGAKLGEYLPVPILKKIFSVILFISGLNLLI